MLRFRKTTIEDIDNIRKLEESYNDFVSQWSPEQHISALSSEDQAHLIFFDTNNDFVGYTILQGLTNSNHSIELMRIAIAIRNKGYGKMAIKLLQEWCFEELKAHRLWLDVREHNLNAQHVYKSMGFKHEGILRDAAFYNDKYESLIVMSMLEQEYLDLK
ncbi:GNAT family N-acetyltransferase [Bacillus sp. JJ722]|uniref:GNAT family N-acetyltransferase n=1 Tax=Bacillus sp. JJ722 TaxID=3122973 RepID=UPI002FFE563F